MAEIKRHCSGVRMYENYITLSTFLVSKVWLFRHYLIGIAFLLYAFLRFFRQYNISTTLSVLFYALCPLASDVLLPKHIGFFLIRGIFVRFRCRFFNHYLTI